MTKLTPERVLQSFAPRLGAWRSDESEEPTAPAASALSCFLSSSVEGARSSTVTFPALELRPSDRRGSLLSGFQRPPSRKRALLGGGAARSKSAANSTAEEVLSKNLGKTRKFDKLDVPQAPSTLLRNLTGSFQLMIDDALRRTVVALMQRSLLQAGKVDAATARAHAKILKLLYPPSSSSSEATGSGSHSDSGDGKKTRRSPIRIAAAATNWATLPPSSEGSSPTTLGVSRTSAGGGLAPLVLPLIFEAVVDADVLGLGGPSVSLRVPGTISASFNRLTSRIETASVVLDTDALYDSMRRRTAELVERAAEVAFALASRLLRDDDAAGAGCTESAASSSEATKKMPDEDSELKRDDAPPARHSSPADNDEDDDALRMPPPPPRPPRLCPPRPSASNAVAPCCLQPPQKRQRLSIGDSGEKTATPSPSVAAASIPLQRTKLALVNPAA